MKTQTGTRDKPTGKGGTPTDRKRKPTGAAKPKVVARGKPTGVDFTNVAKVMFPEPGYTKGDLLKFYLEIAP